MLRRIAHLDMDAFYASVELRRRPELAGLPLVIGGRIDTAREPHRRRELMASRGVVTTANYAARQFGVHSAMPVALALRKCPDCVFLPVDFDEVKRISREFKAAIRQIAPKLEDRGIDEVYLDLTDLPGNSRDLAQQLKAAVKQATGLTCSVGVAPNKLLAKIASDLDKPDGLTLITPDDIPTRIWPLPASRINGIGPKASTRLTEMGIHTIGEIATTDPARLADSFGTRYALWMLAAAQGHDDRPVVVEQQPKSRSRETTLARNTRSKREIANVLSALCDQLADDLARRGLVARCIGVKVKFQDFTQATRDRTIAEPTRDPDQLREAVWHCMRRVPLDLPVRLLGVRAGELSEQAGYTSGHTPSLF